MTRSHVRFFGLAVCLAWAVLPLGAQQPPKVEMLTAHRLGKTPPMREYLATHHLVPNAPYRVFPLRKPVSTPGHGGGGSGGGGGTSGTDPVLQSTEGSTQVSAPMAQFDGTGSVGYVPPDTNISVGPTQVVETVNVDWQVYSKTGAGLLPGGPAPIHAIFQAAVGGNGAGGDVCTTTDGGDPIVLYDKIDQKWIIAQLAYNSSFSSNEYCLAISESSDATGSYYAYDLPFGSNLPDYPKLAIWANGSTSAPSSWSGVSNSSYAGVYFSANIFSHGSSFTGAVMCGFPLSQVATPPSSLNWVCAYNGTSVYSILPADLEGSPGVSGTTWPAPANTAEYYMQFSGSNTLNLFTFAPDFSNGTANVYSVGNVSVATFNEACGGSACVPQLNTNNQLDSLGDRLMYRLSYRNDGTNQYMVVTQSVQDSSSSTQTGVRWYQLSEPASPSSGSGWTVAQQGTFGPSDGLYRWMGSIAQDKFGDLALGYSTSSPSSFPGMGYTGWAPGIDSTGTLEGEQLLSIGAGDQTSTDRWGDYSSMSLDPTDDCTFWYANEYLEYAGSYTNWGTYIASFAFPACTGTTTSDFSLSASPTSQTVTAGSPTSYGVTVTPSGGFNSDVTLSASGFPSGASGTFTTNPVAGGSGSSTLNVTTDSATTPVGTYTLTIGGSGGGVSHSIPVTLVVNGATTGGFSLSANATSLTLSAKSSTSTTITVSASGGFNGAVTLSVSGLPHGTNASFNPSSVTGSGNSTLTISAGGHPQKGTYALTITGTSGSLSSSTTVQLVVQ